MAERGAADPTDLDPVVIEGLKEIQSLVYRRRRILEPLEQRHRNLTDPRARAAAVHLFTHLKHHGYTWQPGGVRDWARAHGWPAADVEVLGDYAGRGSRRSALPHRA